MLWLNRSTGSLFSCFREVCLSHNQISSFPQSLLNLKQLNVLDLAHNKITEVPAAVAKLEATELVLNCNQVSLIAPEVSQCPRLKTLRLEENCLALDSIPTSLLSERWVANTISATT